MSRSPNNSQPLVASILDRLLDDEPEVRQEPQQNRTQVLRELRHAVRRDLEHLLNTHRRFPAPPPELRELERSLATYGLPDFTASAVRAGEARDEFRRVIEDTIRRFEPRFKKVEVQLGPVSETDRTLRFRIDALLYADPAPEPIVFDSTLDESTGDFHVEGAGG
jgi:type VI secretion system protein ImpF